MADVPHELSAQVGNRSEDAARECCATTSSPMMTCGKPPPLNGGGVLLGEDEKPLANWPDRMMKYFLRLIFVLTVQAIFCDFSISREENRKAHRSSRTDVLRIEKECPSSV